MEGVLVARFNSINGEVEAEVGGEEERGRSPILSFRGEVKTLRKLKDPVRLRCNDGDSGRAGGSTGGGVVGDSGTGGEDSNAEAISLSSGLS